MVADAVDPAVVHVQCFKITAADESVAGQGVDLVVVQVQLRHIHRDAGRDHAMDERGGSTAVDDVVVPSLVVVAVAVVGAAHFTVTGVKVTTVAESETVRLVLAQKGCGVDFVQGNQLLHFLLLEGELAVDFVRVDEARILTETRPASGCS